VAAHRHREEKGELLRARKAERRLDKVSRESRAGISDRRLRPWAHGLDSIIVGYYKANDLVYVARVRNGFVPASRRQVFGRLRSLEVPDCPFINLPKTHRSRWGEGLTAEDMKKCVWLRPELVAQIEFLEWTASDHLRHSKFVGLREGKDPRSVVKEHAGESDGIASNPDVR
jgi:ATP-dependent DNA ligase